MFKVLSKLIIVTGLLSISFTSIWLLFPGQTWPAQAKEASGVTPPYFSADPNVPAVLAGSTISLTEFITSGLSGIVQLTHAGDGSGRLFVVEQEGRIRIIKNGVLSPTAFLDITGPVQSGGEQGLLGLAFHPQYESNGFFYVYYNDNSSNIAIARYSVSGNPDVANPASGLVILPIAHPGQTNHNGGQLAFSPVDGFLYAATGDGGGSGDPNGNAQNINSLLGKILRLNVTGVTTYTIPVGNPYAGATAGADEIWALGLRNPFRFSFDRANGDLYIGDVGQATKEEVSYQAVITPGGVNFGWRCREGTFTHNTDPPCNNPTFLAGLTGPIAEYNNPPGSSPSAVTGGFVYRGSQYPALVGYYFYADFYSGAISSTHKTGSTFSAPQTELDTNFNISAFGEDEQGELYVLDYNGDIYRLTDANGPNPNLSTSTKSASSSGADPGETLTYTILLKNTGAPTSQPVTLTDHIPTGLAYIPGSLAATQGSVDDSLNPILRWQGLFSPSVNITITYRVTATGSVTWLLTNQAVLTGPAITPLTLTHQVFVPRPEPFYLPAIYKE